MQKPVPPPTVTAPTLLSEFGVMLKRPPDCHYPKKGTAKNIFSGPVKYGLGNMACWMLSWQWLRTLETLTHSSLYAKEVRFQWWPDYECVWFSRVLGEKLFCGEPSTWRQFNHSWIYNQRLVIGMQVQNGCQILLNYFLGTPKFTRCFTLLGKSLVSFAQLNSCIWRRIFLSFTWKT